MIFGVSSVPALGFTTVFVTASSEAGPVNKVRKVLKEPGQSGGLEISPSLSADMLYYTGSKYSGQPSGAYVFRPDGGKQVLTESPLYSQITGPPTVTRQPQSLLSPHSSVMETIAQSNLLSPSQSKNVLRENKNGNSKFRSLEVIRKGKYMYFDIENKSLG